MEPKDELKRAFQTSVIVSSGITGSLIIYAVIIEFIKAQTHPFQGFIRITEISVIRYVLYAMAFSQVFIIRALRGFLIQKGSSNDLRIVASHLLRTSIMTSALCEIPAILGLVLFFIGGSSRDFYILLVFSFVLIYIYFPRFNYWEGWSHKLYRE